MNPKPYLYVSATVFALVALVHLARLFMGWPVQLGEQSIPMAASWAGLAVAGGLALWGFQAREVRRIRFIGGFGRLRRQQRRGIRLRQRSNLLDSARHLPRADQPRGSLLAPQAV